MAMNRTHMRRQLYRGGGIADLYPRQKFGLGSKIKERIRKLIPNELADVAAKAAPFVAPFNPLAAGIMRGVGRFDKRGSISDALNQGLLTYGGGQAARYLGGAGTQGLPKMMGGQGVGGSYGFSSPIGTETGFKMGAWGGADKPTVFKGGPYQNVHQTGAVTQTPANIIAKTSSAATDPSGQKWWQKALFGGKEGTGKIFGDKGLIGAGGKFDMSEAFGKGVPAVFAGSTLATMAIQKAMGDVGGREPGESLTAFNKRRENTVSQYLEHYFRQGNKFRIAPENMDAAAAKFVRENTTEYRTGENQGGRIGFESGGDWSDGKQMWYNKRYLQLINEGLSDAEAMAQAAKEAREFKVQGGRIGYRFGPGPVMDPRMAQAGLPGIPRMAPDGMEYDMSVNGGFQPLGAKEGKDDVKANLAKNEFVFTADAVRGAGGGDIELGAQKMYDTMKNLEKRMA